MIGYRIIDTKDFFESKTGEILKVNELEIKDKTFTEIREIYIEDFIKEIEHMKDKTLNCELRVKETDYNYVIELGRFSERYKGNMGLIHIWTIVK